MVVNQVSGLEPGAGSGDTLCAVGVGGEFAEFLEFGDSPLGIERHGFSKVH